jgi:hypothetical protein
MRNSIVALLLAIGAFAFAPAVSAAITTHRCTESAITVDESAGVVRIEMLRSRNLLDPSVGYIAIYGSTQWLLPNGVHRIEFAPNQIRKTLELPIGDDVYSGTQTTTVRCGTMNGRVAGPAESESTLTVLDDETPPALTAPTVIDLTETNAAHFLAIPLSIDRRFGRGGFVRVEAVDVTTSPNDYHLDLPHVLFDPDETTDAIHLSIEGDHRAEADEELILRLSGDVAPHEIRIRIKDDDRPNFAVALDQSSYSFDEGDVAPVTITRTGQLSPVTLTLRTYLADDFRTFTQISFELAAGESTKTVNAPIRNDYYTGDRSGTLEIIYAEAVLTTATLLVHEDDPVPVLSISGANEREGNAGQRRVMSCTLRLSNALGSRLPVHLASADGTAKQRIDYTPVDRTVTIPAGRTALEIEVDIVADDDLESDESFTVSIVDAGPPVTLGTTTATITIRNDDDGEPKPEYSFDDVPAEWNESQRWLTAMVLRSNRTDILSTAAVTLHFNNSARSQGPVRVDFEPGETRKEVRFFIDDRFRSFALQGALWLDSTRKREDSVAITIQENEPFSAVSIHDLEVTEGALGQRKEFLISLDPPSDESIVLQVANVDRTTSGDVAGIPSYIIITSLSSGSVPVTIVADRFQEDDETFSVTISPQAQSALPFTIVKDTAVGTILDDDVGARFTFASDHIALGATASITLELDAPAPEGAMIPLTSSAPNVLTVPPNISIAAGSRTATFEITGSRSGAATLLATLPSWLGEKKARAEMLVYSLSLPVLPDRISVPLGDTATITISLTPPADHEVRLPIESLDLRIAAPDPFVVIAPGETATFHVEGTRVGTASISIRLPNELGGTVVHIPVDVTR